MRRMRTRALALTVAGVALAGVMVTTTAAVAASPADATQGTAATVAQSTAVTTWIQGNVRTGPSTDYAIAYTVTANESHAAVCWLTGGLVTANGYSHDKWVRLADGNYIWGGLLDGNETGGVSTAC